MNPVLLRVGLISDTHGLLRPEALEAMRGSDVIVHAGDIGDAGIIDALERIAPVVAVRGNNDMGGWASGIRDVETFEAGGISIHVIHDLAQIDIDPVASGVAVVVSGHSHRPSQALRDGVLYINPGSAGPRRFTLPISVGVISIRGGVFDPELIELDISSRATIGRRQWSAM